MSSKWPSAIASLDDSLAALDAGLQQMEAACPIDLEHVIGRLREAAESSHKLRAMVLSEQPQAEWRDRAELDVLLEARAVLRRRAYLLALANELEYGKISHRRAARVAQLNQLREHAVDELRGLASKDNPLPLPGPDAMHWIAWASSLKEPEDSVALQALRADFARLDEFVAALEPGMWVVPIVGAPAEPEEPEPPAEPVPTGEISPQELEQRRSRLLALASDLERGEVVHHRAIRVTQVNQLREQAIQELRFQAVVARVPATLPGPEAEQWVHWACSLKEPEDTEALQYLRSGFEHLDEFVANIEHDMWVPASTQPAIVAPVAPPRERRETAAHQAARSAPASAESQRSESAVATLIAPEGEGSPAFVARLKAALSGVSRGKVRIVVPTAVLLLAVLGAMQWRLHRTNASTPAKPAESVAPANAGTIPDPNTAAPALLPASAAANAPALSEKAPKAKEVGNEAAKPSATPPEKQVSLLNADSLRTPQAMPKNAAPARDETASAGAVPALVPGGVPGGMSELVKDVSVAAPKLPAQKIRVSSGVAQGQLVHQVTPVYPPSAKLTGIQGTVVLQAVVGKDGKVQNVKVVSGPSMLTQSALDAVKQWRYRPFTVNGEPAEADIEVNVKFAP